MPPPSDARRRAALVLGAAVWPGGVPSPTLARRARHAAALWHRGEVAWVIACGGVGRHPPAEAEVIAAVLRAEGVPEAVIRREALSRTTHENLEFARPILEALGADRPVIVTDATHAPRARLIARGLGLRARAAPLPLRGTPWAQAGRQALREGPATVLALWRLAADPHARWRRRR